MKVLEQIASWNLPGWIEQASPWASLVSVILAIFALWLAQKYARQASHEAEKLRSYNKLILRAMEAEGTDIKWGPDGEPIGLNIRAFGSHSLRVSESGRATITPKDAQPTAGRQASETPNRSKIE